MYYLDMGLMTQCYILGYNWSEAQVTFPDMMWNNNIIITEIRTFLLISNLQFVLTINRVQIIIHRSQIGSYKDLNCYMKVVYYIFTSTLRVVRIHFWTNHRTQVF